jgi:hypothetical protein
MLIFEQLGGRGFMVLGAQGARLQPRGGGDREGWHGRI